MYAYFAFHKIHMRPSEFASLPVKEKALIIAFIDEYEKQKKKEQSKMKSASRKKK
nr:hypothetical protein XLIUZIGB_XLIUZIGB_CDS_0056 [Caudoviricetes sp.]